MMNNNSRIQSIDVLRGVSILMVVMYHYTYHYEPEYLFKNGNNLEFFKYGWIGVDIFFLISGYCIAMTIENSKNFYFFITRRFSRLYPAFFFCATITLLFYYFFSLPGREVDFVTGLKNIFLLNFIPGFQVKYIDGIYWALALEVKFYILFGIVYFLFKKNNNFIFIFFLICFLGSLYVYNNKNFNHFFFSIFPHINIFFFGVCLFNVKIISKKNIFIIIICILSSLLFFDRYKNAIIILLPLIIFFSIILFKNINVKIKFLEVLGFYSYSWYLIHNAVGIIIIREINLLGFHKISIITAILFTLLVSYITFHIIEVPLKKYFIIFFNNFNRLIKIK